MVDHWRSSGPPVYISVAGYLGLIEEKKSTGKSKPIGKKGEPGDLNELAKLLSSTGGQING